MMASVKMLLSRNMMKAITQNLGRGRGMCSKQVDKPVKYSASKAAAWKAEFSRSGDSSDNEPAWFQTYAVTGSVAVFLVYFCILREESDIDDKLMVPLYDKIEGLEEVQLRRALQYRLDNGLPTADIKNQARGN
ncbi:hypothetical protein GE061_017326 [Apolygus lucorum]|uniref:Uncharacterized protein n=1 Tax=Apolygus lucorum TaxID=248454 RepID=A0A8S9XCT9_APOLU|nr:hypothetical protein GE061_017326 [Apolygus lucorum]